MDKPKKYKNSYRIASARAQWWDYGWNAAYYITICTAGRQPYFGQIENGKMQLSPVGALADVLWHEIKHHAKRVELDAFVVMPNHIHGILILNGEPDGAGADTSIVAPAVTPVETRHALSLPPPEPEPPEPPEPEPPEPNKTIGQKRFQNQGKNTVSSIIGSYKSAVTKHARRLGYEFGWQPRFHDHIIRDEVSFHRIATYIENNVKNWEGDKFYE